MKRMATALLPALLALVGCDDDDNTIYIENRGTESMLVRVEVDAGWVTLEDLDDDLVIVGPGGIYKESFPGADDVDVIVTRTTDSAVLFADSFSSDDFEDDHGKIELVLFP